MLYDLYDFSLFSTFPLIVTFSYQGILYLIGYVFSLASNIIWLITLTNSVDETNGCIKALKKEIHEKLLATEEKQERRVLKFLRHRVEDLNPMNANGYFTIDKTTLTSMLSVRLGIQHFKYRNKIFNTTTNYCQLDVHYRLGAVCDINKSSGTMH